MPAPSIRSSLRNWTESITTIDVRSLALLRIALGLLCCIDIIRRAPQITIFYTNQGIYSNHYALFAEPARAFSLLFAFGERTEVSLFFMTAFLFSLSFMVGWKTRLSGFMTWILMLSIVNRNLIPIYGGDTVMLNLLLIIQFLPSGRSWSIDAGNSLNTHDPKPVRSLAVTLLFLQLAIIYFLAGIQKNGPTWMEGFGVYYPLFQDRVVTAIGVWVRENAPWQTLKALSHLSLLIEIGCPLLVLSPIKTPVARRFAFYTLLIFQLAIFLNLQLGLFQPMMIAHSIILLSGRELQWIGEKGRSLRNLLASLRSLVPAEIQEHLPNPREDSKGTPSIRLRAVTAIREIAISVLLTIFIVDALSSNALFQELKIIRPNWISVFVDYTSFRQSWGMFSPDVPTHDFYVVIDAELDDKSHVNLLTGKEVSLSALRYGDQTWSQQIDAISRLFNGTSNDQLELTRWLGDRRGGLLVPEGRKVTQVTVWKVADRSPKPEERSLNAPLDVTITKEFQLSGL